SFSPFFGLQVPKCAIFEELRPCACLHPGKDLFDVAVHRRRDIPQPSHMFASAQQFSSIRAEHDAMDGKRMDQPHTNRLSCLDIPKPGTAILTCSRGNSSVWT